MTLEARNLPIRSTQSVGGRNYSILLTGIEQKTSRVGVIGLGYVGLPLAAAIARAGFRTIGFDTDKSKPKLLNEGRSYIDAVRDEELGGIVHSGFFKATSDFSQLLECEIIIICVPTPLTKYREPDLSYVETTARTVAAELKRGQLVVLESTSYPGTTREVLKPILEARGFRSGTDFFVGYSPEREDPGNRDFRTATIPKIVAGDGAEACSLIEAFYSAFVERVVPVSSLDAAEAVKITENVFRAVNIALVNELKVIYTKMGIDIWEVIDAAKTKPFGYMPFYPGPGLGGHCIPIDPFYLSWKSREFGTPTRFIELAGEINLAMPRYVISCVEEALDRQFSKPLGSATVLIIGLAYKRNVADVRESPAFRLMEILEGRGAAVNYHDPHVPVIPTTREHAPFSGRVSLTLTPEAIEAHDVVIIVTDHDAVDYRLVAESAGLVVDTRNAFRQRGIECKRLVGA